MIFLRERSKKLSRDLSRFVSQLSEGVSERGVHRLRTTIRRLETLAGHTGSKLSGKQQKALKEIRGLRKRAGKLRDLDIQIGLLASLGNGSASADRRVLAETLKRKKAKHAGRLKAAAAKVAGSRIFERLARLTEDSAASPTTSLEQIHLQLSRLAQQYTSRHELKSTRLHKLRVQLKLLRYRAELAEEGSKQGYMVEQLKSVQDAIGEWHDWEMLAESAEKQFGDRLNCALLVEIRSVHVARQSAANSAAASLLAAYAPALPKRPASVQSSLAFAKEAASF